MGELFGLIVLVSVLALIIWGIVALLKDSAATSERRKQRRYAELQKYKELNIPVEIRELSIHNRTVVSEVRISYGNVSDKEIKFIYFGIAAYNRVGDMILTKQHMISGGTTRLEVMGPIALNAFGSTTWELDYLDPIALIKITSITVTFMDGTQACVPPEHIKDSFTFVFRFSSDQLHDCALGYRDGYLKFISD